jgi:hypothetical protein
MRTSVYCSWRFREAIGSPFATDPLLQEASFRLDGTADFLHIAESIPRIFIERASRRQAEKRGGGYDTVALAEAVVFSEAGSQ